MLGPAPLVDFDGTLTDLDVPWAALRAELGIARISDLWTRPRPAAWDRVRAAETEAARRSVVRLDVMRALEATTALAILSNNSEVAVRLLVEREPALAARVRAIVGRETLQAPKTDFDTFARGFAICIAATASARKGGPVVYVGDLPYELDFARRLGAIAYSVAEVART